MTRALQLLLVILAALTSAGCTALASQQAEIKRIEQDWGANQQKQIWIYQP
jgi:hypothetical protein